MSQSIEVVHESVPVLEIMRDRDWEMLLAQIDEGNVIPVIGPDLLEVETPDGTMLLDRYLAGKLARDFDRMTEPKTSLNDVVCLLLEDPKIKRELIYCTVNMILQRSELKPPPALLELARIRRFNLFVSTTFDGLLESALLQVRGAEPRSMTYSPRRAPEDIVRDDRKEAIVYHLLGKSHNLPRYVLSEEDLLEFVHGLQSESQRLPMLFDELKNKNLLVLGAYFPDWLTRFFLRTAKQGRLSEEREATEFFVAAGMQQDESLALFLKRFSKKTDYLRSGNPLEFVRELSRRWCDRHPSSTAAGEDGADAVDAAEMPHGAVFVSYAHEDAAAARTLSLALRDNGIPVWFDESDLQSGDRFDDTIVPYIQERCACFVAVLSRNTEARRKGYFRKEWNVAVGQLPQFSPDRRFFMPVIVDDIGPKEFQTLLPDMKKLSMASLPGGKATPEFIANVKKEIATVGSA